MFREVRNTADHPFFSYQCNMLKPRAMGRKIKSTKIFFRGDAKKILRHVWVDINIDDFTKGLCTGNCLVQAIKNNIISVNNHNGLDSLDFAVSDNMNNILKKPLIGISTKKFQSANTLSAYVMRFSVAGCADVNFFSIKEKRSDGNLDDILSLWLNREHHLLATVIRPNAGDDNYTRVELTLAESVLDKVADKGMIELRAFVVWDKVIPLLKVQIKYNQHFENIFCSNKPFGYRGGLAYRSVIGINQINHRKHSKCQLSLTKYQENHKKIAP
ncbi:hypothetical protein EDC52_10583 [Biostraticola tofi]|uniref:Uncharacterized protein n=2 Tax=Biostraticola tofi TaxID=466109 RepID=A0A4R3YSL5_9GAMM|nr:hypothetical protein EDC52_10583 [Biostraticola tofi]